MTADILSSLRPMLAAPWHQRRNMSSAWGTGFFVFMVLLGPALTLGLSAFAQFGLHRSGATPLQLSDARQFAAVMRLMTVNAGAVALSALVFAWWSVAVANLLEQNRPVLARLVPGHVARLRVALVVGWCGATVATVLLMAGAFGHAWLCAAVAGPLLAFLALAIRWQVLWLLCTFGSLPWAFGWRGAAALDALASEQWVLQPGMIVATLAAMSVVALVALVQGGGRRHIANDRTQRDRRQRFRMRSLGQQPMAEGKRGAFDVVLHRPYYAWWRRTLARADSAPFARLMLGLGPGTHWSTLLGGQAWSVVLLVALLGSLALLRLPYPRIGGMLPDIMAYVAVGIVFGMLAPALQLQARLQQTRREQAVLALLPGVPQGATLSRRVAWRFSGQFAMALAGAVLVLLACRFAALVLRPADALAWLDDATRWLPIATLPMVVFLWRPWSRVGTPSAFGALVPTLLAGIILAAIALGTIYEVYTATAVALVVLPAAGAWCAFRWWRMGREPRSLPAGRFA